MKELEIKWMALEQAEETAELVWESFHKHKTIPSFIKEYYRTDGSYRSLIALYEGQVVGHVWIDRVVDIFQMKRYFYLRDICVQENFRTMGIATTLMKKVEEIAKKEAIDYLELTSSRLRVDAHRVYQKLGYQIKDTMVFVKAIDN